MVTGYKTDPGWPARQIRTTGQVSRIMSDTDNQMNDMIARTFQDRSASQDRMFEQSPRAVRDQVFIEDPDMGELYEAAAGRNYDWWLEGDEAFVGTEAATSPCRPNHWVREMHLRDSTRKRKPVVIRPVLRGPPARSQPSTQSDVLNQVTRGRRDRNLDLRNRDWTLWSSDLDVTDSCQGG